MIIKKLNIYNFRNFDYINNKLMILRYIYLLNKIIKFNTN